MKWLDTARAYVRKDAAARSVFEVILLYPGYHALGFYRVANKLYRLRLFFLARLISNIGRFFTGIEIHPGAVIGRRLVIDHGMGIVIGETSIVGDDVLIYHGVTLGALSNEKKRRHPIIGDNVLIGANASILGAVKVGNNAKIGAHALVLKDVEAKEVVFGIPATCFDVVNCKEV